MSDANKKPSDAKAKFMARRKNKQQDSAEKPEKKQVEEIKVKNEPIKSKANNEWEDEEETVHKKTAFKIDGAEEKDDKEKEQEIANWDDKELGFFKPQDQDIPSNVAVVGSNKKTTDPFDSKSASDIQFGGSRPVFGGGKPKFTAKGGTKIDQQQFPDLGAAAPPKESESKNVKSSNGAPKFQGGNRFEALKALEPSSDPQPKPERSDKKGDFKQRKPRQEKDEFFSNFRSANKDIKAKEASPPKASDSTEDSKPKFSFTNNKKGAMTMAKAQEEAKKNRVKFDQEIEEERKAKEEKEAKEHKDHKKGPTQYGNKDGFKKKESHTKKDTKDAGFHRADKVSKPKPKKEKVAKPPAELQDEWGQGNLEDILK